MKPFIVGYKYFPRFPSVPLGSFELQLVRVTDPQLTSLTKLQLPLRSPLSCPQLFLLDPLSSELSWITSAGLQNSSPQQQDKVLFVPMLS